LKNLGESDVSKGGQFYIVCCHVFGVGLTVLLPLQGRDRSDLSLSGLKTREPSSRYRGLICGQLAPNGPGSIWLEEYDLDVKNDQTTDDVHHVMSAKQNRQSFRILAPNLSGHLQAVQHYPSQIVHDLTFILFIRSFQSPCW